MKPCMPRAVRSIRWRQQAASTALLLWACLAGAADDFSSLWREAELSIGIPILVPGDRQLPVFCECIEFDPLSPGDRPAAAAYLRLYRQEFSKYPAAFLARVNVEWVALVKNLKVDGNFREATYLPSFAPTTMAPRGGLVFDVRQGAASDLYLRWALHHEFFHFIDAGTASDELDAWQALNPGGFRYTNRPAPFQIPLEHPTLGALTAYAMKSAAEDRAEVAAALFMDGTRASFRRIMGADPVIRRKAKAIMRKLQAIDASMSRTYFRAMLGFEWK
jgi:hypothetical protein